MPQARLPHRILRIFLLAALVAAVLAAPSRLLAQESAQNSAPAANPAAQPAQTSATSEAVKPEAAQSEEEQNNAFRLEGPLVKATAKALNLPVTTTASIFEIINFAIIALAIGIPLFRWLPKFLRKRGEKVRADIESARKVSEDANARLSAIEAKLSGLGGEIARIRVQVEVESLQDEARIKSTIGEESARIVVAAEQEIGASAAQARRSLRHFAADLAIDQAVQQLVLTPENDRALIAEFLGDAAVTGKSGNSSAGKVAHKGGQN